MVELWIKIKGSREKELIDTDLLVFEAVYLRSPKIECRDLEVKNHWLNEVRLLGFVESRLVLN